MNNSSIEWTDHTHNEWIGCEKISDGCKHCYAEELMDKRYGRAKWGANGTRTLTSIQNRNKPLSWDKSAGKEAKRYKVFAQSLSDTFEDRKELEPWRLELFRKIVLTPNLDWLVLTKRPDVAMRFFNENPEFANLPNLWLGVSVEDQKTADARIPVLLEIPASIRFLSCEPLLGLVGLDNYLYNRYHMGGERHMYNKIDWVIAGGESGPNARPMHPYWVRSLLYQCQWAKVPFFFKQWGEWLPGDKVPFDHIKGEKLFIEGKYHDFGDSYMALKVGKKKAGSLLYGKEWKEFPVVS